MRTIFRTEWTLSLVLSAIMGLVPTAEANGVRSLLPVVTVMDFADQSPGADRHAWIGEALSEWLTSDLVESREVAVVDREKLAAHYSEMSLARDGLVSPESASQFGRIAAATHVVFGTYGIGKDGTVRVEAAVLDVTAAQQARVVRAEATIARLMDLKKDLSLKVLAAMNVEVSEESRNLMLAAGTASVEAIEAYYQGRLAIRAKELETALGHMLAAIRADLRYAEPQADLIDVYRGLGAAAHARLARETFYRNFPNHKLVFRALYDEAEELREVGRTADAIAVYERIVKDTLGIYAAGALVRLAELKAADKAEKVQFYNRALQIRPDIGLFKEVAVKALHEMGALKGETARRMCFAPVEEIREIAFAAVAQEGDPEGLQILRDLFRSEKNHFSNDRSHIGHRLLERGTMEDLVFLFEATKEGYSTYGGVATLCSLLAQKHYEGMLDALPQIIASVDPKGQIMILDGLGGWDHPQIKATIRGLLRDSKHFGVLMAACRVSAALKDKESAPLLRGLLTHEHYQMQTRTYEVRKAAYEALLALGEQVEKPVLTGEGFSPPTRVGTAAEQGIRRKGYPSIGTLTTQQNGEGVSWAGGKGYGYRDPMRTLDRLLKDGSYVGFIHYNPWASRTNALMQQEIKERLRAPVPILSAASIDDLRIVDSVVAVSAFNIEEEVMIALRDYVRGGGGLVVFCAFNMVNPDRTDTFYELMGLPPGSMSTYWYSYRQETHFTAVADHPLVQGMPQGVPMPYGPNFYSSLYYEKELFTKKTHTVVMRTDNPECEAVVARKYGKGRIVILNWNIFLGFKSHVGPLTGSEFLMRCMDWAGGMQEKYIDPWEKLPEDQRSPEQKAFLLAYRKRWNMVWQGQNLPGKDRSDIGAGATTATNRPRPETFAVLPFDNPAADRSLAPLAEGMLAVLGSLIESACGFHQVERQDMARILTEQKLDLSGSVDPQSATKAGVLLGARHLVFSSLQRDKDDLVLKCRLHNVETTVIAATAEARGRAANIVALLQTVAAELGEKVGRQKVLVGLPTDGMPLANLHYLQGLAHMHRGDPARAVGEFTTARRYAPSHAPARRWLAQSYRKLGLQDHAKLEEEDERGN